MSNLVQVRGGQTNVSQMPLEEFDHNFVIQPSLSCDTAIPFALQSVAELYFGTFEAHRTSVHSSLYLAQVALGTLFLRCLKVVR